MIPSRPLRIATKVEPPSTSGKVPPNDLDLEAAVLGDILVRGASSLDECVAVLRPEDFYSDANANVYQACLDLAQRGSQIGLVSVGQWLKSRDRLAAVGGPAHLATLADAPAIRKVREQAAAIASLRRARLIIAECQRVAAEGYGDIGQPEEWCQQAEQAIATAANRADVNDRSVAIKDALTAAWTAISQRLEGKDDGGLTLGIPDLDRLFNRVRPGNLVLIGARSHIGKSTLGRQWAAHVAGAGPGARTKHGVLIWSGEQPADECSECMTYQLSGVSESKRYARDGFTNQDWSSLTEAVTSLGNAPIIINDRGTITPAMLAAEIRRARRQLDRTHSVKLAMVMVDYIGLMSAAGLVERNANRERELGAISGALKQLAMDERVVLVVAAQLNRKGDERKDSRPRPGDIRDSDKIFQDCDKCVFIHNPNAEERMRAKRNGEHLQLPEAEEVELIVAKARNGTLGTITAGFSPTCGRFWSTTDANWREDQ